MKGPAAALVMALALSACAPQATEIPGGRLGMLRLFVPEGSARAVVLWLGGGSGWSPADEAAAHLLAAGGAIVAGVDLPGYIAALSKVRDSCLYLVGDAGAAARAIERRQGLERYLSPYLAGAGLGGRLALAMLRQAPPATLAGAAAIDPAPGVQTAKPICAEPPRDAGMPDDAGAKNAFIAYSRLAGADAAASSAEVSLAALILHRLPATRDGMATAADPSDLPLVELPAVPGAPLVVILSGDGGWRDIDRAIAQALHRLGYAVVGWDSLRYFWQAKTPGALGHDLARVLAAYRMRWHPSRVALVGYSFGADVLPFAFNRLPAELRRSIVQISLLGLAGRADFEIRVAGWLGAAPSNAALDDRGELARIDPPLIQCFYGAEETDSACRRLKGHGSDVIETGGGHHFAGDYAKLALRIADGIAARSLAEREPHHAVWE